MSINFPVVKIKIDNYDKKNSGKTIYTQLY